MSLNLTAIQTHFKRIGKIIYVANMAAAHNAEAQKAAVGLLAQEATADSAKYSATAEATVPFHSNVKTAIGANTALQTNAKQAVENLLRNVIAVDLGLSKGATVAAVGTALITAMTDASATVGASGVNPSGIGGYFDTNFSIALPQSGSPNVPNTYIDDDVV